MILTECDYCHKKIYKYPYELKNGGHKFCSSKCFSLFTKIIHKNNVKCFICGKDIYRRHKSKTNMYFCGKICQDIAYKKHIIKTGIEANPNSKILKKQRSIEFRYKLNKKCKICGIAITNNNKNGYCKKCLNIYNKEFLSNQTKELMKQGKIKPWQTRNIMSYPEKFFKKILDLNHIKYEGPNYSILQSTLGIKNCIPGACYFLDFKIGRIDLEIDGKQHTYKDRAQKDNIRDYYLKQNGYIVYRIKWRSINTEQGKLYIKNEIQKLLKFLKENAELYT